MVRLRKVGRATVTAAPYQRADLGGDTNACEHQAGSDSASETLCLRPHKRPWRGLRLRGGALYTRAEGPEDARWSHAPVNQDSHRL